MLTAQMPIRPDGSFDTGPLRGQIELCFSNLRAALAEEALTLEDVVQAIAYFVGPIDRDLLNQVWTANFKEPWPNRSILGVRELAIPGVLFHLTATAWASG